MKAKTEAGEGIAGQGAQGNSDDRADPRSQQRVAQISLHGDALLHIRIQAKHIGIGFQRQPLWNPHWREGIDLNIGAKGGHDDPKGRQRQAEQNHPGDRIPNHIVAPPVGTDAARNHRTILAFTSWRKK